MTADLDWVKRNLGFDPITQPAPDDTYAFAAAAHPQAPEDVAREIIDFDSFSAEGAAFFAFSKATGLSAFKEIPWPAGLAPQTSANAGAAGDGPLPKADVLVVTWTVDEGHALSRVLTPGKDSRNDYVAYTHNFAQIAEQMERGCPAVEAGRLGTFWMTSIGGKSVVVFKSESHMSQDGPKLPNLLVWKQIIGEVQPQLVITTGTGGGIGPNCEVGDVVVSPTVHFNCIKKFKNEAFAKADYSSAAADTSHYAAASALFAANADQLPTDNTRAPRILLCPPGDLPASVVTTDFFGFDDTANSYGLKGLGALSEMGDAVLGLAAQQIGAGAPPWLAIRNVSDPQIKSDGLTLAQQAKVAAQIYKGYGRWSSICSAIVCWAAIAAL